MNVFALTESPWIHVMAIFLISLFFLLPLAPVAVHAQGLSDGTPTSGAPQASAQPQSSGSWCEGVLGKLLPQCLIRGVSVAGSMIVIYLTGWFLGIAGTLLNASIALTTAGFDSQIYARIQGGIEATWTVFRDIANIVIIGMFTFIALTMILGIEKFNARQMVAKVLLIAVLINFSLLFTRLIIQSSNFLATQFYKAAQFGAEPASSAASAAFSLGQYSTGISGKFAQLLGVTSVLETGEALWKAEVAWWDPGFMTLALGMLTAIVMVAAALMFFYIAFLLIARAILFIFLLITSSLAFASYLIPNGGGFAGYGWDSWWKSLLKNAVFGPLMLMLLWATIQVGTGIKALTGSGTIGGLLSDPTKGGNINALFSYLIILGMLYVSVKIATKFSHEIGGFSYASLAPAYGAGLLGRLGGFLGRQTLGRAGADLSGRFAQRAKDADKGSTAQKLYNFGAQSFAGAAKRDFNLMRTQLGKEIGGVAQMKELAGKSLGGFQGVQDTFKKQMAESSARLAYSDEEKKAKIKNELEKAKGDPAFKTAYDKAEKDHEDAKQVLEQARKDVAIATGDITNRYKTRIEKLEGDRLAAEQGFSAGTITKADRDKARNSLKQAVEEQKLALNIESNKIKRAESQVNSAAQQFENLSASVIEAATKAGALPEKFASAGEIAEATVKNSFTSLLRASMPTPKGVEKLAEKVGKEAGKPKVSKTETVDLARAAAREKLGEDKSKKP